MYRQLSRVGAAVGLVVALALALLPFAAHAQATSGMPPGEVTPAPALALPATVRAVPALARTLGATFCGVPADSLRILPFGEATAVDSTGVSAGARPRAVLLRVVGKPGDRTARFYAILTTHVVGDTVGTTAAHYCIGQFRRVIPTTATARARVDYFPTGATGAFLSTAAVKLDEAALLHPVNTARTLAWLVRSKLPPLAAPSAAPAR